VPPRLEGLRHGRERQRRRPALQARTVVREGGRVEPVSRVVAVDEQPRVVDPQALCGCGVEAEHLVERRCVGGEAVELVGRRRLDVDVVVQRAVGAGDRGWIAVHPDLERRLPDRQTQHRLPVRDDDGVEHRLLLVELEPWSFVVGLATDGGRQLRDVVVGEVVDGQDLADVCVRQLTRRRPPHPRALGGERCAGMTKDADAPLRVTVDVDVGRLLRDPLVRRPLAPSARGTLLVGHRALLPLGLAGTSAADAARSNLSSRPTTVKRGNRVPREPDGHE
jgi:hypothetical protein